MRHAKQITGTNYLTPPPHEPGVIPRWLHEQGATTIIAGGMGMRAQQIFAENNITVVTGAAVASSGSVGDRLPAGCPGHRGECV